MKPRTASARDRALFIVAAVALTLGGGIFLAVAHPTVQQLPGWFWGFINKGMLDIGVIVLFALLLPFLVHFVASGRTNHPWRVVVGVLALMGVGLLLQHGLALAEKRGLAGMRDRMIRTGHAEFARTASMGFDSRQVLTRYEELMRMPTQQFARSKPPGQLLCYMALASAAERVMPGGGEKDAPPDEVIRERYRKLVDFSVIVLPFLSYGVLIPLVLLARLFLPPDRVLWPLLLYMLAPPTALVTLHFDQAVYPTLVTTTLALVAYGCRSTRRVWLWGLAAGATAWVALFVTFSVLPMLPLAAVLAALAIGDVGGRKRAWRWVQGFASFAGAFVLLSLLAYAFADYNIVHRWKAAMANHEAWMIGGHGSHPVWRAWPHGFEPRVKAALLNLIEFGYWLGPPFALLFLWAAASGLRVLLRRPSRTTDVLATATAALLVVTAIFGDSIGETARLWIFMIPVAAILAADKLNRLAGDRPVLALQVVAICQFAWMFLLKARQDFY